MSDKNKKFIIEESLIISIINELSEYNNRILNTKAAITNDLLQKEFDNRKLCHKLTRIEEFVKVKVENQADIESFASQVKQELDKVDIEKPKIKPIHGSCSLNPDIMKELILKLQELPEVTNG